VVGIIVPDCARPVVVEKSIERKEIAVKLAISAICRHFRIEFQTGQEAHLL
jgi:hypothetical protein